jgi:hypothetical protein
MSFPFHVFNKTQHSSEIKKAKKVSKDVATSFDFAGDNDEILKKILDDHFYCHPDCISFLSNNCDKFQRYNMHMIIIVYNLMVVSQNISRSDDVKLLMGLLNSNSFVSYNSYLRNDTDGIQQNMLDLRIETEVGIYRKILLDIIHSGNTR